MLLFESAEPEKMEENFVESWDESCVDIANEKLATLTRSYSIWSHSHRRST